MIRQKLGAKFLIAGSVGTALALAFGASPAEATTGTVYLYKNGTEVPGGPINASSQGTGTCHGFNGGKQTSVTQIKNSSTGGFAFFSVNDQCESGTIVNVPAGATMNGNFIVANYEQFN